MPASAPTAAPPRVVIVDDAPDLRRLLRRVLEKDGFEVVAEAADGQQGLDAARTHVPDVVLLDLAMPVMDGMEALPRLRELCPAATVVVLSSFGAAQTIRRAMAAGADGYLQKGQPMSAVVGYVRALLEAREDPTTDPQLPEPPEAGAPTTTAPALPAAVREAAYGVLEVLDEPIFRVVSANHAAERLLGRPCPAGTPLFALTPALAGHLAQHRGEESPVVDVVLAAGPVPATLRRAGGSLLLFLGATEADLEHLGAAED